MTPTAYVALVVLAFFIVWWLAWRICGGSLEAREQESEGLGIKQAREHLWDAADILDGNFSTADEIAEAISMSVTHLLAANGCLTVANPSQPTESTA